MLIHARRIWTGAGEVRPVAAGRRHANYQAAGRVAPHIAAASVRYPSRTAAVARQGSYMEDRYVTAHAVIDGKPWYARVRQFPKTAYIEVWGDHGFDIDCHVRTPTAMQDIRDVAAGNVDHPDHDLDVMRRAAAIFDATEGG